jgi:glycine/D-amino acid oxidase-like deaminating enzyme
VEAHSLANLAGLRGVLEAIGEPCRPMGKDDLARAIGTRYYRAGIHIGTTVLLQPAALVRGLASTLPANVDLFEQSPVHAIERRHGWTIRAGSGGLCTERVFLAVNGFAPALGVLRQRIFPLHTFASLTRVLDAGEQASAGEWRQWGLVSEDRMGSSLRRTADQRILVRNSVRYLPSLALSTHLLARIRERHRRSLVARWPALRDVELEFTWGGVLGMTANQGQFFGRLAEGLYASIGYNGTGVALGTASGMLLADHALGIDSELLRDALALPRPAWIPPEPLLGLGLRPALALLERRAGAEL